MTTTEKNILIAQFMGLTQNPANGYEFLDQQGNSYLTEKGMQYHKNWSWLMPVVERIESFSDSKPDASVKYFNYDMEITQHSCYIESLGIHMGGFHSKIEAVYSAVVAFIEWYNQNKTQ